MSATPPALTPTEQGVALIPSFAGVAIQGHTHAHTHIHEHTHTHTHTHTGSAGWQYKVYVGELGVKAVHPESAHLLLRPSISRPSISPSLCDMAAARGKRCLLVSAVFFSSSRPRGR